MDIINNNNLSFYIDNNKNNTTKYIIYDKSKNCYYTCKTGIQKGNMILKFVLYACYKISNNLTKCNFNQFDNIINKDNKMNLAINYNKLYYK